MVKILRVASIPVAALIIIATNATSNQSLRENLWVGWLAAALIVLAGLLCVGRRWMYFVFPLGVAVLLLLLGLAYNYSDATGYFGHRPSADELSAW
ncbi:MAG: hypothetical protein WBE70_01655, partial [Candidatus Acidiferrum sp.]